jgi:hypothetical protein
VDSGQYGLCGCGKKAWPSKAEADAVVVNAKISTYLRGSVNRRESRSYECEDVPGLHHVTSRDRVVKLPTYAADSDAEAMLYLSRAAERGVEEEVWEALVAPERAAQTVRVLGVLHQESLRESRVRKAEVDSLRKRAARREVAYEDYETASRNYESWMLGAVDKQTVLVSWIRLAREALKESNIRRASDANARDNVLHRDVVRRLTLAVAAHRARTECPTEADRELWAWLGVLSVPYDGSSRISLAGLLESGGWKVPELAVRVEAASD